MNQNNDSWRRATSPIHVTIKEVVNILDKVALRIVLVTDESDFLIGTISDGDVRRGLLKGLSLDSPIESIVKRNPIVVSSELSREKVLQIMTINKIQQVPLINERKEVVGLYSWNELNTPTIHSNLFVIMAGGKGTRLHPQTINSPKPLLTLRGKPILEHIIDRAKNHGFNNFVIAIHYLGHMIQDHFGEGDKFGVKIRYLNESTPLGTAGALSLLDPKPNSTFIVTNGDVVTDINYAEILNFHQQNNASATMAVKGYEWQNPFGVVQTEGLEITGFEEKPITRSYVNAGVYVLEPSSLSFLKKSETCDMPTLLKRLKEKSNSLIAYPIHEPWLDIGRPEDLKKGLS
jgi:dTDP-glucose pyrophosphorylase